MKKTLLYSAIALAGLSMNSCGESFLLLDPVGSVSEGTLTTAEGIDYVLTAAYSGFYNMTQVNGYGAASLSNYVFGDVVGGDANKGSTSTDQSPFTDLETYAITDANLYVRNKWQAVYEVVKRANNVLDMATKLSDLPNIDQIEGQALFIKGVWMFEGIKIFGAAIPYVSLEDYRTGTDPIVSNVDESGNYVYIWDKVEADLKEAISKLPETWPSGQQGRATSWMAKAMLAKLYLYWSSPYNGTNATDASKRAQAKSLFKEIIDSGKDAKGQKYKLAAKYGDLYDVETSDWTGESIFDCQMTISGTQINTNSINHGSMIGLPGASGLGGWGFYQPSFEFVNSFIVDENGLPLENYTSRAPLTPMGVFETDLDTPVDPRLDFTAGRFDVPYLDWGTPTSQSVITAWIRDYTNGGMYFNKKNQPKISDRGKTAVATSPASTAKNFHVLRLADVMLMYAECCILDGDFATAESYINMVRARAANDFVAANATTKGTYTLDDQVNGQTVGGTAGNYRIGLYPTGSLNTKEKAWEALKRERRAELGMEGHHWFDLARWNEVSWLNDVFRAYDVQFLPKYKSNNYGANWVTFPIPINEIRTAQGRFVQNVNWK